MLLTMTGRVKQSSLIVFASIAMLGACVLVTLHSLSQLYHRTPSLGGNGPNVKDKDIGVKLSPSETAKGPDSEDQEMQYTGYPVATSSPTLAGLGKFVENFSKNRTVVEDAHKNIKDINWWVNSGAYLYVKDGIGRTIHGPLPKDDVWRIKYAKSKAGETDNGYYPQNIFRLVTRSVWNNLEQSAYFRIDKYNLSSSKYRQASNGLLLFNHYQDGYNLYYTGLRVDGYAVVKKKYKSNYYTMALAKVFDESKYDRDKNPNLIPLNTWIGVKSRVFDEGSKVHVQVYIDIGRKGIWNKVIDVVDDGKKYGGTAITKEGFAGIRTDFMDVSFDDYKIEEKK